MLRPTLLLFGLLAVASALPLFPPLAWPAQRHRAAATDNDDTGGCPVAGIAARCPPYTDVSHHKHPSNYTERVYASGLWVTTALPDAARVETAGARGYARLSSYFRGNNEAGKTMDATAPLAIGFEVEGADVVCDYVVAMWVGERGRDAPDATVDEVKVKHFPKETFYVANWTGGLATQGVVLEEMRKLATAVKEGGGRIDKKGRAWLLSYSPYAQISGKYYEVALPKKEK